MPGPSTRRLRLCVARRSRLRLILRLRWLFAWLAGLHMPTLLREAVTAQSHAGNSAPGQEVQGRLRATLPGSKSPPVWR